MSDKSAELKQQMAKYGFAGLEPDDRAGRRVLELITSAEEGSSDDIDRLLGATVCFANVESSVGGSSLSLVPPERLREALSMARGSTEAALKETYTESGRVDMMMSGAAALTAALQPDPETL